MSVVFFWKGENYIEDMASGKSFHLNQNNELIINLHNGEHVWAFTRIQATYALAVDLVVTQAMHNQPGYKYGAYRAFGDRRATRYFDVYKGIDIEPEIRKIFPKAPSHNVNGRAIGLGTFFQGINGVRPICFADEQRLVSFSRNLKTI